MANSMWTPDNQTYMCLVCSLFNFKKLVINYLYELLTNSGVFLFVVYLAKNIEFTPTSILSAILCRFMPCNLN